jgi:hypothetical protein
VTRLGTGDRVQLYGNDKPKGLINGYCGTVTRCEPDRIAMKLDNGKTVEWNPKEFRTFGLGYAGTVYRGQGKTQMRAYYLHTPMAERKTSMVALTRHREQLKVYAGRDRTADERALARQVSRHVERGSSLAYEVHKPGRGKEPEVSREPAVKPERTTPPGREHAPPPRASGNSAPEPGRGPSAPTVERTAGERSATPTPNRPAPERTRTPDREAARPTPPEPSRAPGRSVAPAAPSPPSPSGRQAPGVPGRTPSPGREASRPTPPEPSRTPGRTGATDPPSPSRQPGSPIPGRRHVPTPPDLSRLIPKFERELDSGPAHSPVGALRSLDGDGRREVLTARVRTDIATEMAATKDALQRSHLTGLYREATRWITLNADKSFLKEHEKLDAKTVVHAVGLRYDLIGDSLGDRRTPYLPMDRELKSISESLGRTASASDPGRQPGYEQAQSDVLRALENRIARVTERIGQAEKDAGLIAWATRQVARDEKRELRELRYKEADIEHGRGGEGEALVQNLLRERTADWHMHRDIHNGHVRALNEVEAIRAMPLADRGRAAERLAGNLERSGMREEGGRLREAVERRPADPPRAAEPTRERERTKEPTIERDRGYDRSR